MTIPSKGINIVTLIGILGIALSQLWIYGDSKESDGKTKEKITNIEAQAKTHVNKAELDQRLITQEIKIQIVSDDVKELKDEVKENQKLLQQILREMPRKPE